MGCDFVSAFDLFSDAVVMIPQESRDAAFLPSCSGEAVCSAP
jgi:hypothetical protein